MLYSKNQNQNGYIEFVSVAIWELIHGKTSFNLVICFNLKYNYRLFSRQEIECQNTFKQTVT